MINYLGRVNSEREDKESLKFIKIVSDYSEEEYQNSKNFIQDFLKFDESKINVFSSEGFIVLNQNNIPKRLYECFNGGKVLVVIRNQFGLIKSQYGSFRHKLYRKNGKYVEFNEWIEDSKFEEIEFFNSLKYDEVINEYAKFFKKENIKILLFEDLSNNKEYFIKEISDFLEVDYKESSLLLNSCHRNETRSDFYMALWEIRRKYFRGFIFSKFIPQKLIDKIKDILNIKAKKTKANLTFSKSNYEKIQNFYRVSNQNLIKEFSNLNIKKYNYPL
jgi:hypothetical protein